MPKAINVWRKKHHHPNWTMDELICRAADQAYFLYFIYGDSPFDPPIESFLINLMKNRPFKYEVRLRSNRRRQITVHTAPDQIIRQRQGWENSRKDYQSWVAVSTGLSSPARPLPLPPHYTLSLDIFSKPKASRHPKSLSRNASVSILLTSALVAKSRSAENPTEATENASQFAATPTQLLSNINAWERSRHQPEMTLDEVTVRFADTIMSLREANDSTWDHHLEPVLKCLARNAAFVYSMPIYVDGWSDHTDSDSIYMVSTHEKFPLPSRRTAELTVSIFPSDMKEEEPLKEDWKTVTLSYAFPAKAGKAKAVHSKVGQ